MPTTVMATGAAGSTIATTLRAVVVGRRAAVAAAAASSSSASSLTAALFHHQAAQIASSSAAAVNVATTTGRRRPYSTGTIGRRAVPATTNCTVAKAEEEVSTRRGGRGALLGRPREEESSRAFFSTVAATNASSSQQQQQQQQQQSTAPPPEDTSTSSSSSLIEGFTMDELTSLASQPTTPLSLSDMYKYASAPEARQSHRHRGGVVNITRLRNAQFLHRELPIRVAQRAVDLLTLPHGLNRTKPIRDVASVYLRYLRKFQAFPVPTNAEQELAFTDLLQTMVLDRTSIPSAVDRAVRDLKDERRGELDVRRLQQMEEALYRFFTARVGLRFLTEHHILSCADRREHTKELRRNQTCMRTPDGTAVLPGEETDEDGNGMGNTTNANGGTDDFLGCIRDDCDAVVEVQRMADQVTRHCRECYGVAPDIEVVDCTDATAGKNTKFTYVPHHLQYMLGELLKNSCRATVRSYLRGHSGQEDHTSHHDDADGGIHDAPSLPPVRVVVSKGDEDLTIKVDDRGGGMPRSVLNRVWTFTKHDFQSSSLPDGSGGSGSGSGSGSGGYNTDDAETDEQEEYYDSREESTEFERDNFTGARNMKGFGLPLARIYARYFGGELTLKSMEGYGVDAYLYLPVLGVACENLPDRVHRSPGNLDSSASEGGKEGFADNSDYAVDGTSRHDDFWDGSTRKSRRSTLDSLSRRAL